MKRLWHFSGGLHLPGHKSLSNRQTIRPLPAPPRVYLPLQQHIGAPAEPLVGVGERVDKGQPIARAGGFVSAGLHAPVSGQVVALERHRLPHPSGIAEPCIVIENDGEGRWWPGLPSPADPEGLSVEQLRERIRGAGIVGLGGAVFPSAAKLSPPREIDTLIINGVECEPYITCDDLLMRERSAAVVGGARLLRRIVNARRCLIAVEDNKPEAIASLRKALGESRDGGAPAGSGIEVVAVPTRFPAGGEKQLVRVLTGREVPAGGLPYEVGAVCLNVGTCAAVHEAACQGRPLVSRVVTVSGAGVRQPGNFEVPLGTRVSELLAAAGGVTGPECELIMGGPMMGQPLPDDRVMVVKGTNCILVQPAPPADAAPMPCIRCGSCAGACPMRLLPQQLYWHARGQRFDRLERFNLDSCIECGCCAVVCPSRIPLVDYFKFAKSEIRDQEHKRLRATESRARNEARKLRLEALEREKEARRAKRKADRGKRVKPVPKGAAKSAPASAGERV